MILPIKVNLNEIDEQEKDYRWPRPDFCGRCHGNRLWGHGFVETIFAGYRNALLIHRYRCPECGCIMYIPGVTYAHILFTHIIKLDGKGAFV